jgi:glutamate dehydrogenase (NADP+)
MSDSSGLIYDKNGITEERLAFVKSVKNVRRGRIAEYTNKFRGSKYVAGQRPWGIKCDCAFPCATQNEITGEDARKLIENGCYLVSEAANMPSVPAAVDLFIEKKILFGPGKAANAGGVATSGLEMSQNSMRLPWPREEVDSRLRHIMSTIFKNSWETAAEYGQPGNLVVGANIAGFVKVADAMLDQGVV